MCVSGWREEASKSYSNVAKSVTLAKQASQSTGLLVGPVLTTGGVAGTSSAADSGTPSGKANARLLVLGSSGPCASVVLEAVVLRLPLSGNGGRDHPMADQALGPANVPVTVIV